MTVKAAFSWRRLAWVPAAEATLQNGVPVVGAAMPCAVRVDDGSWCVLVTGRDPENRGHVLMRRMGGDVAPVEALEEWRVVLAPGPAGAFDESGVVASDIRKVPGGFELLYHGYRLRSGGGWWNAIGRAVLTDVGEAVDRSMSPEIGLSDTCPISVAYASWDPDGTESIWFNSAEGFDPTTCLPSRYVVCRRCDGRVAVEVTSMPDGMFALTRPVVVRQKDRAVLFASMRGTEYTVAEFALGAGATEPVTFPPLGLGGEVRATAYPFILRNTTPAVLLYNGDGYGRTGFGVAVAGATA